MDVSDVSDAMDLEDVISLERPLEVREKMEMVGGEEISAVILLRGMNSLKGSLG